MDPNATYALMTEAYEDGRWEDAHEAALNLKNWLVKGGFSPDGQDRDDCIEECLVIMRESLDRIAEDEND